ncbi:hypothetical protein VNO78_34024 [Psophocarpus tetragonolobus]|uniref:EamA domain-containing protein n=1 Tax=Psophocarpus tetragonolobus TaxID=3891 RepID=A0AAN9RSC3_PSOTE
MGRRWSFYLDVLPIVVIIGNQVNLVGLLTLYKAATLQGMNEYVFIAYSSAIATIILFPITFLTRRARLLPPLSFSVASKITLLSLIGTSAQIIEYIGISYSSPALASSIKNLGPAFTFILAVIFRMEKIVVKSRKTQAKVMGSIVSVAGAFVLSLYKGPSIIKAHSHLSSPLQQPISFLKSEDANWLIASIMLTAECFIVSACYIVQVILLHNVSGRKLSHIVRYCFEHLRLVRDNDSKEFDKRFVAALSVYEMKELVLAANYLNMKKFLDFLFGSTNQVDILTVFPDEVTMVLFFNAIATVVSTIVALYAVPNASSWKIGFNISLVSIICAGTFQKVIGNILATWALRLKGAVYVVTFAPLQIVISVVMAVIFLGDTLHVGSIIGGIIGFPLFASRRPSHKLAATPLPSSVARTFKSRAVVLPSPLS